MNRCGDDPADQLGQERGTAGFLVDQAWGGRTTRTGVVALREPLMAWGAI
ncbi:hypothetical protein [Streptomyces kaniharaensis]|nr:hypothetical protein [Streptomyces kaniharaensis]